MYFLNGWPKRFNLPLDDEPILSIKVCPSQRYFAVITISCVYIWSSDKHRIILGFYKRTPASIDLDGSNEEVYWRPSGHLILSTRNGKAYFLDITLEDSPNGMAPNVSEDDQSFHALSPKSPLKISLRGTFSFSRNGIAWIYESNNKLYTCTHDGFLQKWAPSRDSFQLAEEVALKSFSQISLKFLVKHPSNDSSALPQNNTPRNSTNSIDSTVPDSGVETEYHNSLSYSNTTFLINNTHSSNRSSSAPPTNSNTQQEKEGQFQQQHQNQSHTSDDKIGQDKDDDEISDLFSVLAIRHCPKMKIMVAAFQGGKCAVLIGDTETELSNLKLFWLPIQEATTSIELNSVKRLISIGLSNGDVCLFDVQKHFKLSKTLTLNTWGISKRITGAVTHLCWTQDGRVLAVGYAARGFSTWTSYGCRLSCSISQSSVASMMNLMHNSNSTPSTPLRSRSNSQSNISSSTSDHSSYHHSQSIHQHQPFAPLSQSNRSLHEVAKYGVRAMCWGEDGYHLLISSSPLFITSPLSSSNIFSTTPSFTSPLYLASNMSRSNSNSALPASKPEYGIIDQLHFVKSCISSNVGMNHCQRILLQGEDRLLMLANKGKQVGNLEWRHLHLPTVYIQDNWPIRHVSVSPDGVHLAVSGRSGFVIYNCSSSSWSMFGDRAEEQSIHVLGLSWFQHFLVATVFNDLLKTHQVIFFPRTSKLSFSSVSYQASVPQNKYPIFVDCNDTYLVLFTHDSYFQYKIIVEGGNSSNHSGSNSGSSSTSSSTSNTRVSLKLVHQLGLDIPFLPTAMLILPSNAYTIEATPPNSPTSSTNSTNTSSSTVSNPITRRHSSMTKFIILDAQGNLMLNNAERTINILLSQSIEQFWIPTTEMNDLGNTLWAYGERGLETWFPFFTNSKSPSQTVLSRDQSLEFDLEVCPIAFLPQWGIIVGLGQGTNMATVPMTPTQSPCFSLQTKTQPFLHYVLRKMLEKNEHSRAVQMAAQYTFVPHFTHTLELLLHETLELQHEHDTSKHQILHQTPITTTTTSSTPASSRRSSESSIAILPTENPESSTNASASAIPPLPLPSASNNGTQSPHHKQKKSKEKTKALLRKVLDFLKIFGPSLYSSIIVSCARKTDPTLWPTLFNPKYNAGKPKALFEQAIEAGKLEVAASFLRVIQLTDGEADSRRAALQCLEFCLYTDDLELLRDLIRFLEPLYTIRAPANAGSYNSSSSSLNASLSSLLTNLDLSTLGSAGEDIVILENTLASYARKLLSNMDIRSLVRFSRIARHDLRSWMAKERTKSAIVPDYLKALDTIHLQYSIPKPTHFPITFVEQIPQSESIRKYAAIYFPSAEYIITEQADNFHDDPMNSKSSHDDIYDAVQGGNIVAAFKDLEYFLEEAVLADCVSWALIAATILFQVPVLLSVLKKHPVFWKVYKPMLEKVESKGYEDLLAHLSTHIK